MAPRAHHGPRFVLCLFHPLRSTRLDVEPDGVVGPIHLEIRLDRYIRKVILRLSEGRANGFRNTDDQEGPTLNQQFVADRVDSRKELGGQVVADHGDLGAALVVALGDVASVPGCNDVDIHHIGGDAADVRVIESVRARAHFPIDV